mmetsp:Transcript_9593/g.29027  ORF Transcript_9593/g.29027 Transcript_9593/m.29027 type:complete len:793 (+) Transcript_9593:178-2556(+)|eukprot:CAMPEP_0198725898 /NCGR_PEP_ID=MMETSP1475-20131203/3100_1 /TAXON_ID= ORGANISM="Unidentified sp., Strain CCMP1999" /NCGR_SAMPLE_ID=MMETSP1475 /ASSEMBLY_ACC=CAM_ASM_001111 /LENGTH=792 /DNA_ID=CAMNT_0044487747 /DNA_START=136 /DNA_END=2514 /DNA_ORIENTATION=-
MATAISEDGSIADSSRVGSMSDDSGEISQIGLLNGDIVVALHEAESRVTALRKQPTKNGVRETEIKIGEVRGLYEEMKNALRELPPEERSMWLPQARQHQDALKKLIGDMVAFKRALEERETQNHVVEVEDEYSDDEPMTVSDNSVISGGNSSVLSNEPTTMDRHLTTLEAKLDDVHSYIIEGRADEVVHNKLVDAQEAYDEVKDTLRNLPAESKADALPLAREARDKLQELLQAYSKLRADSKPTGAATVVQTPGEQPKAHIVDETSVPKAPAFPTNGVVVQGPLAEVERMNHDLSFMLQSLRNYMAEDRVDDAQAVAGEATEAFDNLKEEIRGLPAEERMKWLPEAKAKRAELAACLATLRKTSASGDSSTRKVAAAGAATATVAGAAAAVAAGATVSEVKAVDEPEIVELEADDKDAASSGGSIAGVTESDIADSSYGSSFVGASQRTEDLSLEAQGAELQSRLENLDAAMKKLENSSAPPDGTSISVIGAEVEKCRGNYDSIKNSIRSLSPKEKQTWIPTVKSVQKELQDIIHRHSNLVGMNPTQAAYSADEDPDRAIQELGKAIEDMKADALELEQPEGHLNTVEDQLARIASLYEKAQAKVVTLPESDQTSRRQLLRRYRDEYRALKESRPSPLYATQEGGSSRSLKTDGSIGKQFRLLESNLDKAIIALERETGKNASALTRDRVHSASERLEKAKPLYDEYKESVRALPPGSRDHYVAKARAFQERLKNVIATLNEQEKIVQMKLPEVEKESADGSRAGSSVPSIADSDKGEKKKSKLSCCICS